ncbi:MAG: 7-cyano-7-deazaguanine synthase [Thermoplasmata archaeon]
MDRAIVLVSGGIDSAVSLFWCTKRGWDVCPLTFHSYMRPQKEVQAVMALTEASGCRDRLIEVHVPFLMEVDDLLKGGIENPLLKEAPLAYVPSRNLIFYSIAAHYGEVVKARWIIGGHNGADSDTFPDASPEFFQAMNRLLSMGLLTHSKSPIEIVNPLQGLTKTEVVRLGLELEVPLDRTWSCNWDLEAPCGDCSSCVERAEAFREIGLEDPLLLPTEGTGL